MILNIMNNKKQRGITLIELMVSLLIGLILLAGILRIFINSNQLNRHLSNIAHVQEDGRIGVNFLKQTISLAGFRVDPTKDIDPSFFPIHVVNTDFDSGAVIAGTDDGNIVDADSISIRFIMTKFSGLTDCLGLSVNAPNDDDPVMVSNRFYIINKTLLCQSSNSVIPQPLIENVEAFKVLYGLSTDATEITANCYISATTITTDQVNDCGNGVNFKQVASIRIHLILSTDEVNLTHDGQSHDFDYEGIHIYDTEKKLYRGITLDIALKNKITTIY